MRAPSPSTPALRVMGERMGALAGWALVAAIAAVVLVQGRGSAEAVTAEIDLSRGATVYAANCTACHGSAGGGIQGTDRTAGPSLVDIDAAYVDLTIRTGRMPLHAPEVGVVVQRGGLGEEDRESLVVWMVQALDLPDTRPAEPIEGDVARGHELYAQHCAACHGGTGAGGVSGDGTQIRPVIGVDRVATVEAIRIGPFRMPRFAEAQLDDQEAADVAVFVDSLQDRARTPLGLFEIDRVAMAVLVVPLLLACAGVILLVGRPVDAARRPHERPLPDGPAQPDEATSREVGS